MVETKYGSVNVYVLMCRGFKLVLATVEQDVHDIAAEPVEHNIVATAALAAYELV
jgi:hypothetical protein